MEGLTLVRPFCCSNALAVSPPRARPFLHPLRLHQLPMACLLLTPSRTSNGQLSQSVEADSRDWAMQDFYSLRREVETASARVEDIRASAGLQQLERELAHLEVKAPDASFWDDRAKAQQTLLALTDVKDKIRLLSDFKTQSFVDSELDLSQKVQFWTGIPDCTRAGVLLEKRCVVVLIYHSWGTTISVSLLCPKPTWLIGWHSSIRRHVSMWNADWESYSCCLISRSVLALSMH